MKKEKSIINKILIKEEVANLSAYDDNTRTELEHLRDEFQVLREQKLRGAFIRSRAQIVKVREKPTNFFLNLEDKNYVSKSAKELKINDQNVITNTK